MTDPAATIPDIPYSRGATIAPDMSTIAYIVDPGGYPRAVQRAITGGVLGDPRPVTLGVEGPVTKVGYSPDGRWLACQTAPYGGERQQIWAVTNDPTDVRSMCLVTAEDGTCDLVGWDGDAVCVTVERSNGAAEAVFVVPDTGSCRTADLPEQGRLLDHWAGWGAIRVGGRGDRGLRVAGAGQMYEPLPRDPGSVTDLAVILDDHDRMRLPDLPIALRPIATGYDDGYLRMLVRTDHSDDRLHLVQLTYARGRFFTRVLARRDDADLDAFAVSNDAATAVLVWNVAGGLSAVQVLHLEDGSLEPCVTLHRRIVADPSLSFDGSLLAVTLEAADLPPAVWIWHTRTGEWTQVGDTRSHDVVHPRPLEFTARDGLPLQGWWYPAQGAGAAGPGKGEGATEATIAPTVLMFHGGPEGQWRPTFNPIVEALVQAGYNVLGPNVRGSGGFGRRFWHADDHDRRYAGIDDVEDIVAGLTEQGLIDRDRLAITGRSYGGYLTMAALTFFPGLFAVGVAICGMSDLRLFYAETETWIGRAAYPKYGHPVDDAELLDDLSPIHRIEKLDVPIMLVHGARDTNVSVSQSQLFHAAAKQVGVPTELVVYPDEGHEFVRRDNLGDLAQVMIDWLDRTLR